MGWHRAKAHRPRRLARPLLRCYVGPSPHSSTKDPAMHLLTPDDFLPWVGKTVKVNTLPQAVEVRLVHAPCCAGAGVQRCLSLIR